MHNQLSWSKSYLVDIISGLINKGLLEWRDGMRQSPFDAEDILNAEEGNQGKSPLAVQDV